tara:strand:- start:350 stop:610 length:261 start_codon:yes stop_codon:yes gene_type:complete
MSKPKLRKVNLAKRKEQRRKAAAQLEATTSMIMDHPTDCCMCKKLFTRNQDTVKTWMITVAEEKKTAHLTCPDCWATINEVIKCQE